MRIGSDRFASAIQYVSEFGRGDASVVFTPHGPRIRISVRGDAYAEYWCDTIEPLEERFAVRIDVIGKVAKLLSEDDVVYMRASDAKFTNGESIWRIPFSISEDQRPEIKQQSAIDWDGSLSEHVSVIRHAAMDRDEEGVMDCVCIEVGASKRKVVGSDGKMILFYREAHRDDEADSASILIENRFVNAFLHTCLSGSAIKIKIGLLNYSVECGKRIAIFPLKEGVYPKWEDVVTASKKALRGGIHAKSKGIGRHLRMAAALSDSVCIESKDGGVSFVSREDQSGGEVVMREVRKSGKFGPISLSCKYLSQVTSIWPHERLRIQFSDNMSPVVFAATGECRNIGGLLSPVRMDDGEPAGDPATVESETSESVEAIPVETSAITDSSAVSPVGQSMET